MEYFQNPAILVYKEPRFYARYLSVSPKPAAVNAAAEDGSPHATAAAVATAAAATATKLGTRDGTSYCGSPAAEDADGSCPTAATAAPENADGSSAEGNGAAGADDAGGTEASASGGRPARNWTDAT